MYGVGTQIGRNLFPQKRGPSEEITEAMRMIEDPESGRYLGNLGNRPRITDLFEDAEVVEAGELFHGGDGFADGEAVECEAAIKSRGLDGRAA